MKNSDAKATILLVDDIAENIDVLREILKHDYKLRVATDGQKALDIAFGDKKPDLILLDVMMPNIDGFEVCQRLKSSYETSQIPVIFVTAKGEVADESKGFDLGAVDYITKPISPPRLLMRVRNHLHLYDQKRLLDDEVLAKTQTIEKTRSQIIQRLGVAAEYKDNETGLHIIRMSKYSELIAREKGLSDREAKMILDAAPMHDIGKIGIPDSILLKPGKLDAEEWEIMKQHPQIGVEILGNDDSELLSLAREIAISHHEKFDGSGYPNGLSGQDIPLSGRIVAIADVFDALTAERPYKKAWPLEKALNLLKEESGAHFDPELVDCFMRRLPEILAIKEKYAEDSM